MPLDIVLDTAHGIGHTPGLEHAERPEEVHLLMHKALCHTIGNAAKMSEERARELLQATSKQPGVVDLYKRKGGIGETPGEIWTVLHGPELTPGQIELVLANIKSKADLARHWRGGAGRGHTEERRSTAPVDYAPFRGILA